MTDTDNDGALPSGGWRSWLRLKRRGRKREEALRDVLEEIIEEAEAESDGGHDDEPIAASERGLLRNILRLRDADRQRRHGAARRHHRRDRGHRLSKSCCASSAPMAIRACRSIARPSTTSSA